jgi:hydroxyacylglutathione hydrolase
MLNVTPLPAFDDNYIWVLRRPDARSVAVVDPGDEVPVLDWLEGQKLTLAAILVTHHHGDHTGGVRGLLDAFPGTPVLGPARERIPGISNPLREGDRVHLECLDAPLQVLDVPGHTAGHIAYYGEGALFCGDTLFAAGCGRVFGGTLGDLHASLQRIAALPPQTLVYCAHEYTLANLGFARWVEPASPAIREREAMERQRREAGEPTVPSSLALELATNPFLRTGEPAVRRAAEAYAKRPLEHTAEIFAAVRTWKDKVYD